MSEPGTTSEVGRPCTCANDGSASRCPHHSQADYDSARSSGIELSAAERFELFTAAQADWLPTMGRDPLERVVERIITERERKAAAKAWDEACEHDLAICRTECETNPYRTQQ